MSDHDCPPLGAATIYEGDTGDAAILIQEMWGGDTDYTQVAFTVSDGDRDNSNAASAKVDPEEALKIAAAITDAAHRALWRREMAG